MKYSHNFIVFTNASSGQLWVYRGYNGALYSQGRCLSKKLDKFHQGDKIRFIMDHVAAQISVFVNGKAFGPVFTEMPLGVPIYPAVSFYGSDRSVKLLGSGTIGFTDKSDSVNLSVAGTVAKSSSSLKSFAVASTGFAASDAKYATWEFQIQAGASVAIGAAIKPVATGNYDSDSKLYTFLPATGAIYNAGKFVKNIGSSGGTKFKFTLDHDTHTVSMSVNGVNKGK